MHRAHALFGDPSLPAEFASARGPEEDLALFLVPDAMGAALTAEIRTQLEPYLVTPIDPRSAFYAGDTAAPVATVGGMAQTADPACGNSGWTSQESTALPVKIWAKCTGDYMSDIATTLTLAEANWPPMTALMGDQLLDAGNPDTERGLVLGGDSSTDVYLTDETVCPDLTNCRTMQNPAVLGWANYYDAGPPPGEPAAGFVVMRRALLRTDPVEFRKTLIHEFFHVLEFAHNTAALSEATGAQDAEGNDIYDVFWFSEASATWAEWHFEQLAGRQTTADLVHQRFIKGFQGRDLALDSPDPIPHRYSAYVWPLFMSQQHGPEIIDQAWEQMRPRIDWRGAMDAVNGRLDFSDHFHEFAVQNLNFNVSATSEDPRPYAWQDAFATFPEGRPTGPQYKAPLAVATDAGVTTIDESLARLSAHYYTVSFDQLAQRISIDATGLDPTDAVSLAALIQVGDAENNDWRYRELELETEWCANRPDEDVRSMYLIVSDHDMVTNVRGPIKIEAASACTDADITIEYDSTSVLHAQHWTISGNVAPNDGSLVLGPDQPIGDYPLMGVGSYEGWTGTAFSCSMPAGQNAGDGEMYLTVGEVTEEGWPDAPFEGPAVLIGAFHKGDIEIDEGLPPIVDLGFVAAPAEGGTVTHHLLKAEQAECGDRWEVTIEVTYSPGDG